MLFLLRANVARECSCQVQTQRGKKPSIKRKDDVMSNQIIELFDCDQQEAVWMV